MVNINNNNSSGGNSTGGNKNNNNNHISNTPRNSSTAATTATPSGRSNNHNSGNNGRNSPPPNRCVSPRDPTIRHAGRTHIRGKIRRVWRPRYLELCDSGLVRYYELPPTADVTLPEDSDWDHVHMIPKDSLVIYNARIIDVTTLRDLHVGLPRGSYGFLFRGQRLLTKELLVHHPEPNPPRDYFCAVSTLEEAQTWVIALQWAATVGQELRRPSMNHNFSRMECYNPNQQHYERSMSFGNGIGGDPIALADGYALAPGSAKKTPTRTSSTTSATARTGRIVVTKVQGYRIVQTKPFQWHVAYEIALLLIQSSKVEERRLLRTRAELEILCQRLFKELSKGTSSTANVSKIMDTPNQLLATVPTSFSSAEEITKSFSKIDKILRHLVLEATVVNSQALKRCLILDSSTRLRILPAPTWYQSYENNNHNTIIYRNVRSVQEQRDDYVKRWLKTTSKSKDSPRWSWILQRRVILLGCVGILLVLAAPIFKLYQALMISLTLRVDVLVVTWLIAAYIGRETAPPSNSNSKRSGINKQRPSTTDATTTSEQGEKVPATTLSSSLGSSTTSIDVAAVGTNKNVPSGAGVTTGLDGAAGEDMDDEELLSDGDDGDNPDDEDSDSAQRLSSPLPQHPANNGESCWSVPPDVGIFKVRGSNYLQDRIKLPSGPSPFTCRGVDLWLTDNPERHIARHPSVLGGKLQEGGVDTFLVNFLLPFGNFVSYFSIPPIEQFPEKLAMVWTKFLQGDQQYRDARLKLLPVVMEGPWIVKAAVGNGTAPALLGKVIPLQYFFRDPNKEEGTRGVYEVDVIITASSIAKGILSVVKGHTKALTIAFAFIIEAAEAEELPETVLCSFQVHSLHLEDCPRLPECNLDEIHDL